MTPPVGDTGTPGAGIRFPDGFFDEPLAAPSRTSAWREILAAVEVPRLVARTPRLAGAPRGRGDPVLVLPGFGTDDWATAPLRAYLHWLGHDVRGWGMGRNHGNVVALLPEVTGVVAALQAGSGRRVHLLGWSLGGVLAREVARGRPDLVAQVITFGTPVVGGPAYTITAAAYRPETVARISEKFAAANRVPIRVPVTAFFSRRDAVVAWRACIDPDNELVEHIEVDSTHTGLGIDPSVWLEIARRLHAPVPRRPTPQSSREPPDREGSR